jgi:hypothetical protein
VRFVDGAVETPALAVELRDFLHFGAFLLAIREAMKQSLLSVSRIDRARLRDSWEPRREILERRICDLAEGD